MNEPNEAQLAPLQLLAWPRLPLKYLYTPLGSCDIGLAGVKLICKTSIVKRLPKEIRRGREGGRSGGSAALLPPLPVSSSFPPPSSTAVQLLSDCPLCDVRLKARFKIFTVSSTGKVSKSGRGMGKGGCRRVWGV